MEHSITMLVHREPELFSQLVQAASERLEIPIYLVEKDYYISLILKALSQSCHNAQIVFKGGTALSKAYALIDRFSEDVDFAVISAGMSGNRVKALLSQLMKEVTLDLEEDRNFVDVSKGSKYRKQAFNYVSQLDWAGFPHPTPARVIVEISAFANPFPHEKRKIEPLVTTFLQTQGMTEFIDQYSLGSFELNVLSLKQTLCEKLVALIRFSMSADPLTALRSKIRHFYDIEALLRSAEISQYTHEDGFLSDIQSLIRHDQSTFSVPKGWNELRAVGDAPVIKQFEHMWNQKLGAEYERNLSLIAYKPIPPKEQIAKTFADLIDRLKNIVIQEA